MKRLWILLSLAILSVFLAVGVAWLNDVGRMRRESPLEAYAAIRAAQEMVFPPRTDTVAPRFLPPASTSLGAESFAAVMADLEDGSPIKPLDKPDLSGDADRSYLTELGLSPQDARYFDLIDNALPLGNTEIEILARNGFVASESQQWQRFSDAYAWIYWQDLPVLVTTDSLLHAVHQSYSDLLMGIELYVLAPHLHAVLQATKAQVAATAAASTDPELAPLYTDVDTYLAVALALLEGTDDESAEVGMWVDLATRADSIKEAELLGSKRIVDFTLFTPRSHYADIEMLQNYFRAMGWLAHMDFRILAYDDMGNPQVSLEALAAAAILRNALEDSGQRTTWEDINTLLEFLVGPSDNTTLSDLEHLWLDLELAGPADALNLDVDVLLNQLTIHDYGQQRITGQILYRHIDNSDPNPLPRPTSFMLLGQRFAIDAYVLGNLVYDRLIVDGKPVERALPSPLDMLYALGNDRAVAHLDAELATYPYAGYLAELRRRIDNLAPSFWATPIYNRQLQLLRSLNAPTLDEVYPLAMRTQAWADKVLQTQLGFWAQVRHDNLLYVKQSMTMGQVLCEYPAGYVEPYPEFYAALGAYAEAGADALMQIESDLLMGEGELVREHALAYFAGVRRVAEQLGVLAEKELREEAFTTKEEAFLKSIVRYQVEDLPPGCGGPTQREIWDGWYMDLLFLEDDDPAVIADVHTNPTDDPNSALYPPRVLHAATGRVAPLFFLVAGDEGATLYVGPAYTYYEITETGSPPRRLTDQGWRQRLASDASLHGPKWTSSFRVPGEDLPQSLSLPGPDGAGTRPFDSPLPNAFTDQIPVDNR